jgi:formylmethanofuran dehydrogenase subunit E
MSAAVFMALLFLGSKAAAETPDEWVSLVTRVHGGFGSFVPVGIRIGEDAVRRLHAKARELDVIFYQGEATPCPCAADGVMLAVGASPGQNSLHIAPEKSPPDTFAVVVVRPRKGGEGLKYTVPMTLMPKLAQINTTSTEPLARYNAVMEIQDLFSVETTK